MIVPSTAPTPGPDTLAPVRSHDARAEAARDFEAMVLRPMVETMLPEGAAFGTGTGSEAWRGMLVDALADTLARDGTLGLGAILPGGER